MLPCAFSARLHILGELCKYSTSNKRSYGEKESPEVNIPPTYRDENGNVTPYSLFYNTILHESDEYVDETCQNRGIGIALFGDNCDPRLIKEYFRDMADQGLRWRYSGWTSTYMT